MLKMLGVAFGALKIAIYNRTYHNRSASSKGGVRENELLSESFGSRWEIKVKKKKNIS